MVQIQHNSEIGCLSFELHMLYWRSYYKTYRSIRTEKSTETLTQTSNPNPCGLVFQNPNPKLNLNPKPCSPVHLTLPLNITTT